MNFTITRRLNLKRDVVLYFSNFPLKNLGERFRVRVQFFNDVTIFAIRNVSSVCYAQKKEKRKRISSSIHKWPCSYLTSNHRSGANGDCCSSERHCCYSHFRVYQQLQYSAFRPREHRDRADKRGRPAWERTRHRSQAASCKRNSESTPRDKS